MTYKCTFCDLSSADGNLWCQRTECSRHHLTGLLSPGEQLGDIRITELVGVMRTAAVYRATRQEETLLVKVSHVDVPDNPVYGRYLKNEAQLLQMLHEKGKSYPNLPQVLSPYLEELADGRLHGTISHQDHMRYYLVFENIDNLAPLRDRLNDNPQPPPRFAGWIIMQLVDLLERLQTHLNVHHLALSPETVFIRIDNDDRWRPFLMDMGLYTTLRDSQRPSDEAAYQAWLDYYLHPSYVAPELLQRRQVDATTDVYGLGLLLYEMLAGRPVFEYHNQTATIIRTNVARGRSRPLNRGDLQQTVEQVVQKSRHPSQASRYSQAGKLSETLRALFGDMPDETPERPWYYVPHRFREYVAYVVIVVLIFLLSLLVAPEIGLLAA